MLDVLRPRKVRDVHQAVDAFFDLEECAEIGELPHSPLNYRADAVALRHRGPRIGFQLLDTQRDPAVPRFHFEHHGLNLVADLDHFARMFHTPAPGHLGNVDQTFHPRLDLDKSAVIGDAHHAPDHPAARRAPLRQRHPRVRRQLAQPQRDSLLLPVELQHFDGDFVAGMHHLGGMVHASVRHVAHVQQSIDAAQINERAIFGEVFHHPGDHRAFKQVLQRRKLARLQLFFHGHFARHHHVSAPAVDLQNLDRNILADELIEVVNWPDVDLRTRHEGRYADVHHQPALGALHHTAGNQELFAHRALERIPHPQPACFRVGQQHVAFRLRRMPVHHHIDRVAGLDRYRAVGLPQLLDRNKTFHLVAEIDDDLEWSNLNDMALQ